MNCKTVTFVKLDLKMKVKVMHDLLKFDCLMSLVVDLQMHTKNYTSKISHFEAKAQTEIPQV